MTIELTGSPETQPSGPPNALQQNGVEPGGQASDNPTVLITEAQVALGTAAATGMRRKERRWVALLSRNFAVPKESRPMPRSYSPAMAYLERARMAREMERL
jgi:hypothetical protein